MKITKILLKGYNQFEDVTIDLTYPKGHKKAGNPLDKVCIIGQSGTGKTSLLRVLKLLLSRDRRISENITFPELGRDESVNMDIDIVNEFFSIKYTGSQFSIARKIGVPKVPVFEFESRLSKIKPLLINYPAELLFKEDSNDRKQKEDYPDELEPQQIIDFNFEDVRKMWDYILKDIKEHRAQELDLKNKIGELLREDAGVEEIQKKTNELKEWSSANPNPLKILAEKCLDPILYHLGLKTKTDIDKKAILNLGFIELQTLAGQYVPRNFWSTGTRQLVQTMIPLYQLKPKNAIILIDEPEHSLYPDIQLDIIDTYVNLAPGCQFFFATHSPIIAASFEPWEIVELKFDNEQKYVYRDLHYEGENHVDNYKYHPEYLRWDSILFRIFDLTEEGGHKRLKALQELAEINIRIRKLKKNNKLESPEGKKLKDKYLALSEKLDWRTENEKNQ